MSDQRATVYCCSVCSLVKVYDVPGMATRAGWVRVNGKWLCRTCSRDVVRQARKAVARRG